MAGSIGEQKDADQYQDEEDKRSEEHGRRSCAANAIPQLRRRVGVVENTVQFVPHRILRLTTGLKGVVWRSAHRPPSLRPLGICHSIILTNRIVGTELAGTMPHLQELSDVPIADRIRNLRVETLSDNWYVLRKATFDFLRRDGVWQTQSREAYDRGNGAAILLTNAETGMLLLTRQFRYPAWSNGYELGLLLEVCAGLLDADDPETAIRREAEEETGYRLGEVRHLFDAFMSPGSVTERLSFFAAAYHADQRINPGGGEAGSTEDIELLEVSLDRALTMIESGEICDAKTIMLIQWAALQHDQERLS